MTGARVLAAAALLFCTACGGEDVGTTGTAGEPSARASPATSPTADPARSPTPAATTSAAAAGDEPTATTALGALPTPATLPALQRRAVALPDVIAGAGRAPGAPEEIRYLRQDSEFGIDVSEVGDLGPGVRTVQDAFTAFRAQLTSPTACATPPAWCLRGSRDGQRVVVWGHDQSPLVYAAVAPDDATLQALLTTWSQ